MPDFMAELEKHTYPAELADEWRKELNDSFGQQ